MAKAIRQEAEPVNADSFLDIVASVVCIMLIMVLMVGMRIRNMPIDPRLTPEAVEAAAAVEIAALMGDCGGGASTEIARIANRLVALLTGLCR
jgi:hypothetical protein